MKFTVKFQGVGELQRQIQTASQNVKAICENEMNDAAQRWVAGAKRDAPKDQAALVASISYIQSSTNLQSSSFIGAEIFAQAFYAPFMEFGTKGKYLPIPGTESIAEKFKGYKGGDFMDLLRNIVRWVHRKGITGRYSVKTQRRLGSKISQYAEDYSAAWPIALSIVRNGVKPHPFFFKQGDTVWPETVNKISRALQDKTRVSVILPGEIYRPKIVTI